MSRRSSSSTANQVARREPKSSDRQGRLPAVLATAGNSAIARAVQRRPGKEAGPTAGVLEIDGLPELKVLSAHWSKKANAKVVGGAGHRFPQIEPTKTEMGNLELEVIEQPGLREWLSSGVADGELEGRAGALHLTKPAKGGSLPAGTLELKNAVPVLLGSAGGPSLKLELAVDDVRITGAAGKVDATKTDHLDLGPGWDPVPLHSFDIVERTEAIKDTVGSKNERLKHVSGQSPVILTARVPMGPMLERLTNTSKSERLIVGIVKAGGRTVATLLDALVTEVDVSAGGGAAPMVTVRFAAERVKRS